MRRLALRMRVPVTVVTPGDRHRVGIAEVLAMSLNFDRDRAVEGAHRFPLDDMRVVLHDDEVVSVAGVFPFGQWFGGAQIECAGIWGVATLPEYRAGGRATACVRALIDRARGDGTPVTALFPAVLTPYRRIGYEVAGVFMSHRIPLAALPADDGRLPNVELFDPARDLVGVREAFRSSISTSTGPVEPVSDGFWLERVFAQSGGSNRRTVVVREDDRVTGCASFTRTAAKAPLDGGFGLECRIFFGVTPTARRALWSYFRGHRGIGRWLEWVGPPTDPTVLALADTPLEHPTRWDWMLRVLDVPSALKARGYPQVDAEATISVEDPLYPENSGAWRISVREGRAEVERAGAHDRGPVTIGALSSMFSGYLRPADAVRLGYLDADDPAVEALGALFAGPDPWSALTF